MCMKKLLAPITLLFLVACQPSERERCIVANTEPTPTNNYMMKHNEWMKTIKDIYTKYDNNDQSDEYHQAFTDAALKLIASYNPLEEIVNQCYLDKLESISIEGLTESEIKMLYDKRVQSCIISTEDKVKELQLKIEAENKKKAESVCNSQGIY